jgi:uncharacterized protein DUF4340
MTGSRTTQVLIVAFVVLVGLAYLFNLAQQNATVRIPYPTALPELYPGIEQTQITRIEIENLVQKRRLTLVKVPGDWIGTDQTGKSVPVDLAQVTRMIQILPTLRYNRIMEGSDVKAFGLADGGYFIVRFDAGGTSYVLHVGDVNSAQTYSYVQPGDSGPVLQIPARDAAMLVRMVASP